MGIHLTAKFSALLFILLKGENGHAYNIADKTSNISIKELADMVAGIGGKKVIIDLPDADEIKGFNVVKKSVFSTEKLERLGWSVIGQPMKEKMKKTVLCLIKP